MKTLKKIISNGLILTITSLLLRWIGVLFNSFISNRLGSEGMGVYSLVQSVFGFAVTFACSGVNLGATRLISDALAKERMGEVRRSVRICVVYSLFFSLTATILLFGGADYIGKNILGDDRTVKAVRILSMSLPFISLSSVFNGYFSAVRRVYKSATVMILEQLTQVFVTVKLIVPFSLKNVEYACIAVAIGTFAAEMVSFLYNWGLWYIDIRKHRLQSDKKKYSLSKKLLKISLPLALSTYVRSGLVTIEHLLIPYGLKRNGASYSRAMSTYGLIHGMVFPIIMFPSCIIYSFSGLIVPELAAYNERKEYEKINNAISKVIQYALVYSVGVAGIIICYSYELSLLFYNSSEAYKYIRLFAPLISIMYLDGAVDGVLKGLNEQLHSMKINIADAFLSTLLVYFLVPYFGVKGYVVAIFVCEIFNCGMSLMRLMKISRPEFSITGFVVKPIICCILSVVIVVYLFSFFKITYLSSGVNLFLRIGCTVLVYVSFFVKKIRKKKMNI